ncbi:hypothetical protein ABH920_009643 [Catenulispora sp. EB89]
MERTVGVDLAAQPRTTAAAEILWGPDGAAVKPPRLKCRDEELLDLLSGLAAGERAGIDCLFGWPTAFVEAVAAHTAHQPWPGRDRQGEYYPRMRLRLTDLVCQRETGRYPLSVSMDKLGATAARWASWPTSLPSVAGRWTAPAPGRWSRCTRPGPAQCGAWRRSVRRMPSSARCHDYVSNPAPAKDTSRTSTPSTPWSPLSSPAPSPWRSPRHLKALSKTRLPPSKAGYTCPSPAAWTASSGKCPNAG